MIALPGSWAARSGSPSPVPWPPRDVAAPARRGGFFYLLPRNGCVRQLFNWCVWRGVGKRDFLVHKGRALFAGVPRSSLHWGPSASAGGLGGGGHPSLWRRVPCSPRAQPGVRPSLPAVITCMEDAVCCPGAGHPLPQREAGGQATGQCKRSRVWGSTPWGHVLGVTTWKSGSA